MARLSIGFAAVFFSALFFSLHLHPSTSEDASGDSPAAAFLFPLPASASSRRRPAMVLPLFLSPPNSSGTFTSAHRHLQSLPSAHMRLYDDLLRNGYYTARLQIGTPPQSFSLIADTGSSVTYVPCSTCEKCGHHQDPKFQTELSNTYEPVKCNVDCSCDNERKQCIYESRYAEMSTSSGVLGEDVISFGQQSQLVLQRAIFGCENVETGDLYSQHADGIMGLGRGDLSIVNQLVKRGVINDSFSLCYGGMDLGGGAMVLGGISAPPDMVFTNSDPGRSPYYNIELNAIHVAGKKLPLSPEVFEGKHGTVLDSGTTYAYLPKAAFVAFKDAIMKELHSTKRIHGPDPNYNDICFSGAGSNVLELSKIFPAVDMVFGNGQKFSLAPENYLFRHSKVHGAYCLGVFQNGRDRTTLLGGIIARNTLVTYDRDNEKIGFWKTNCSELLETLHVLYPTPLPSASNITNSTEGTLPPLPSDKLAHHDIPYGELQVGFIMFDVSLNITYSDLKSHISELAGFMAHDLDVNTSQVHMLDFVAKGNGSLIRWAIYPGGAADYISNATATKIISQLVEHRVHLPGTFGSYQLLEWKVEPHSKRTWWKRHYVAGIAGVILSSLGFSALGIWYVWRRNKGATASYRPVDEALPEQELQPL